MTTTPTPDSSVPARTPWAAPGHCVDIDGYRWHDQGGCTECGDKCCGPRA
jgi:hypothetical protein